MGKILLTVSLILIIWTFLRLYNVQSFIRCILEINVYQMSWTFAEVQDSRINKLRKNNIYLRILNLNKNHHNYHSSTLRNFD